jgi:hypothetical protein
VEAGWDRARGVIYFPYINVPENRRTEGEPFELEVELGGVPEQVARWLNPLVLGVLR